MRGLFIIVMLAGAFSAGSITAFRAISDRAERLEAIAARDQMDRITFSRRNGPQIAERR